MPTIERSVPDGPHEIQGGVAPSTAIPTRLPDATRHKLMALRGQRDDARSLLDAAMERVQDMQGPGNALQTAKQELGQWERTNKAKVISNKAHAEGWPTNSDEADETYAATSEQLDAGHREVVDRVKRLQEQYDAARNAQENRAATWQALGKLVTRIEEWLAKGNGSLAIIETTPPKLAANKTAQSEIERLRDLIHALTTERRRIEKAAMPAAEAKARAKTWVERRAAKVNLGGLVHRESQVTITAPREETAIDLACWLHPEAMTRRLEKQIEADLENRTVLTELEQARELKKLDGKILDAERKEEALIVGIETAGGRFLRRPQADPRAVLGVG